MARIRQIKPVFFIDDDLALCSRDARFFFVGLWVLADRAGRLEDRPARMKAQIFPYDSDISIREIEGYLDELVKHCFIVRYQVSGKKLIWIRTFIKHQHCHIKEPNSQLPPPEEDSTAHRTGTVPELDKHGAGTVPVPDAHRSSTSASGYIDNGSGFLCVGSSSGEGGLGEEPKSTTPHTPASAFVLTDELRTWAEALAPEIDLEIETERFRDYYQARGKIFPDWAAQFRTWIRGALDREKRGRRESRGERNERIIREIEAEDAAKRAPPGGRLH